MLLGQDVLYVGGGSMLNLLAVWRAHGVDAILREAWERGIVLCGLSAGSMCWFEAGVTTSLGHPRPVRGLGLLPGSNSVHYDSEPARRPCFHEAIRTEAVPPGWAVDDGAGLLFAGRELIEAVSARAGAGAYWVEETQGEAVETPLNPRSLPGREELEPPTPLSILEWREARVRRR
jgi:dipeptidase E